jgi:hypothetical protein
MSRPTLEVADIVRATGNSFWEQQKSHLAWPHRKVLDAIVRCRTAALGGHRDQCVRCGHQAISYNSCRIIGTARSARGTRVQNGWPRARLSYCPCPTSILSSRCRMNSPLLSLGTSGCSMICSSAQAPQRCSNWLVIPSTSEPTSAVFGVLHTWGQNLEHHPHVHYIVPAGGLAPDGSRWIDSSRRFFLPVHALSRVFRGKFVAGLKQLAAQNKLQIHGSQRHLAAPGCFANFLRQLFRQDWVVYAKPPFGGAEHVLNYLARYTHRVAISNHRLVAFENDRVSFRWRDYAHGGKQKVMTVSADEFLRRFLLHVLPGGLVRIRHFGLFANRSGKAALARCRAVCSARCLRAIAPEQPTCCVAPPAPASCWLSNG